MKTIIALSFFLASFVASAQLIDGDLMNEGRKMLGKHPFLIEATSSGWVKYELAVNREGKVTSATLVETNLKSTPTKIKLRNHAMGFVFEKGTYYPKFHHVVVKITSMKSTQISKKEEELLKGL
ncbi:MAG: hypothetical protein ACI865_001893 [Flavobacteriaceae bacterium]|jgi:hypothetical protein